MTVPNYLAATDFAGHTSEAFSEPFIADTTPPELTGTPVAALFRYDDSGTTLQVEWDVVFQDREYGKRILSRESMIWNMLYDGLWHPKSYVI